MADDSSGPLFGAVVGALVAFVVMAFDAYAIGFWRQKFEGLGSSAQAAATSGAVDAGATLDRYRHPITGDWKSKHTRELEAKGALFMWALLVLTAALVCEIGLRKAVLECAYPGAHVGGVLASAIPTLLSGVAIFFHGFYFAMRVFAPFFVFYHAIVLLFKICLLLACVGVNADVLPWRNTCLAVLRVVR